MATMVMTLLAPSPTGRPGAPPSLREENPVSFVADFGKRAGRCGQRIRAKREIAYGRCPRHLCCIADEFACKAIVIIPNIDSLVHPMPRDGERHESRRWYRTTTKQGIRNGPVILSRHISGFQRSAAIPEVDLNTILRHGNSPEQAIRLNTRIEVVDLRARTGLIYIHSHQCEGPLMHPPVCVAKDALHEAHIRGQKREAPCLTCLSVGLRHHTVQVC